MKIALDYDGTYDKDPDFWGEFIGLARLYMHDVRVVTHRHETHDSVKDIVPENVTVIYTDGVAKKWFCEHRGDFWVPDVWIDDKPKSIFENGPLTREEVHTWRAGRSQQAKAKASDRRGILAIDSFEDIKEAPVR